MVLYKPKILTKSTEFVILSITCISLLTVTVKRDTFT